MGEDLVDLDRAIFNPLDPSDRLGHGVPSSVVERKVGALLTHVRKIRNCGDIGSRGRVCHAITSPTIPSVTVLIRSGETSTPYISARNP